MIRSLLTRARNGFLGALLWRSQLPGKRGWAIYEAESRVRMEGLPRPVRERMKLTVARHPLIAAALAHLLVLILVAIGFRSTRPFLQSLAPDDPGDVLATAWQVHAGFVAIAFAGLAMLIDMAGRDSLIRAVVERRYLMRQTQFSLALFFSLAGAIQLSIVSTWFATAGTVLTDIAFVVTPAVLLIGFAYARAIRVLTDPAAAEQTAAGVMRDEMRMSLDASRALTLAEESISAWAPLYMSFGQHGGTTELVVAERSMRLNDVHLPSIEFVARGLKNTATTATTIAPGAAPSAAKSPPALMRRPLLGNVVHEGDAVFVIVGGALSAQELKAYERLLANSIRLVAE